jgi:SAM-dependent methyltransferase
MLEQYIGHTTKELFIEKGDELFGLCRQYGCVTPDSKVLDVGCGLGRLTRPFSQYLSREGEYWGVDVARKSIDWCKAQYGGDYPNFHFRWVDCHNRSYNPDGKDQSSTFKFDLHESSMDLVLLFSVFTHMHLHDIANYMQELGRILKPRQTCIITWYVLNDESLSHLQAGHSEEQFKHAIPGGLTTQKDTPEYCAAYREDVIRNLYERSGLVIQEPIRYGKWSGRKDFFRFQEFVFATKSG